MSYLFMLTVIVFIGLCAVYCSVLFGHKRTGSTFQDARTKVQEPRARFQHTRTKIQDTHRAFQGICTKVQHTRTIFQDTSRENQYTRTSFQGTRTNIQCAITLSPSHLFLHFITINH